MPRPPLPALRPALDTLYADFNADRVVTDPIWIVHRYERSDDREVVAFIAAALAFGRVQSVLNSINGMVQVMGPSPAAFAFTPRSTPTCSASPRRP